MKKNLVFYLSVLLFFASCETEHLYGPGGILEGNPCDTVDVAYTTHIKPIIDRECVSCHNSTSASSNVILDSYTSVKSAVENRKMKEALNYESGASKMPPSGKLDNCFLLQVDLWINKGMPE